MSLATTRTVIMTSARSGCARYGKRVPFDGYGEAPTMPAPDELPFELGAALCVRGTECGAPSALSIATNVKTETD
jgi:hypothetical protein